LTAGQVEILGEIGPPELSLKGMRVWPYVGFIHKDEHAYEHSRSEDADSPLPSLPMSSLIASAPEVAHVFALPLAALVKPTRLQHHLFRGEEPYWAIDVSDLAGVAREAWAGETPVDEVGGGRGGRLEVWGLTGWYMGLLMRALDVFR